MRYSGGPKVGRVEKLSIDPQDPSRIEVTFSVDADLPVKTDSRVKIMTMTPLGDNHVEIVPGTRRVRRRARGNAVAFRRVRRPQHR